MLVVLKLYHSILTVLCTQEYWELDKSEVEVDDVERGTMTHSCDVVQTEELRKGG